MRMQSCPLKASQKRKRRQGPALMILEEGSRAQTRGAQQQVWFSTEPAGWSRANS